MAQKNEDKTEIKLVEKVETIAKQYKESPFVDHPYGFEIKPASRWFKFKLWLIKKFMPWKVKNL